MSFQTSEANALPANGGRRALVGLLVRALRPLVLLVLKQGMTAYEFNEVARWVFARTAMERDHFAIRNRDVWGMTKSRSAVLTGFTRREVDRLVTMPEPAIDEVRDNFHRLHRVLQAWQTRTGYQDEGGRPRDLPLKGSHSFDTLARECGRDIPVRALLDEALQRGCVMKPNRECVRFMHDVTDGPGLCTIELDRLGRHAENFLGLLEQAARSNAATSFAEVAVGALSPEHREMLQQRVNEVVREFTATVSDQLSSSPRSLLADNADTVVVGVYHGRL